MASDNLMTDSKSQHENESDDLEKNGARVNSKDEVPPSLQPLALGEGKTQPSWFKKLASLGVEIRGIRPVALEDRNDKHPVNIFSFWWSASLSVLP